MKSLTLSLILATSLFVGCSKPNQPTNQQDQSQQASIAQKQETKKGHLCGFPTKKSNPCQRRVAEDKKFCWQHDGLH